MSSTTSLEMSKAFVIDKWEVWQAWQDVKANDGAPGVDGVSVAVFERDLKNNLYKVWNRMSSGSYHPAPVRAVAIPKADGGVRVLGIPTVADRVAQGVVTARLSPRMEGVFHPDSYGYRSGRSAHDAVQACRLRCYRRGWVVKIDLAAFFDTVDHDLLVKALTRHLNPAPAGEGGESWITTYVRRWLTASAIDRDGQRHDRDRGTPQGGVVSPVLANVFLHYAFDAWMAREHPGAWFERYADDIVVHCTSERQARGTLEAVSVRMRQVGLEVHPGKSRIVHCRGRSQSTPAQQGRDRGEGERVAVTFDFLGFTFAPRPAQGRDGKVRLSYGPAVSRAALTRMGAIVRRWKLHRRAQMSLPELAAMINPVVAGWISYYGRFRPSALYPLLRRINAYLMRWARNTQRRLARWVKAWAWWQRLVQACPGGFVHWKVTTAVSNAGMGRAV